jgi:hypothetical protein
LIPRFNTYSVAHQKAKQQKDTQHIQETPPEGFEGDEAWLEAFRRGVAAEAAA